MYRTLHNKKLENIIMHHFEIMSKEYMTYLIKQKQEDERRNNFSVEDKRIDLFYWTSVYTRKLIEQRFDYDKIIEIKDKYLNKIHQLSALTFEDFFQLENEMIGEFFAFIKSSQQITDNLVVNKILNILYWHIEDHYSLDDIVKELNISKSYAAKVFKSVMGTTIVRYGKRLKIERAMQLLDMDRSHSIEYLSKRLGFYDVSHFSKTFKAIAGISPLEYKKKLPS